MDTKITLSFDESIITKAKKFANDNNISLSRLTEFLLSKATTSSYKSIDRLPVSEWISKVSEGAVEYNRAPRSRKNMRKQYYSKKAVK
jgi:hypothetical protein